MDGTGDIASTGTVSTSTPTESSTPSAPSSSTPVTAGSGTPAPPTNMAEGFRQALAPTPEPTVAAPTDAAPATSAPVAPPKPQGPIPFDRHTAALENARRKAAEEVETHYAWAKPLDQGRVETAMALAQQIEQDPVAFVRQAAARLAKHPQYRERLMARPNEGPPQPDMATTDGQHRFYSAEAQQKLIDYHVNQGIAKALERIAPVEQQMQRQAQQERTQAIQGQAKEKLAEAEAWPRFGEYAGEILQAMEQDKRLGLDGAYNRVVVPRLAQRERQAAREEVVKELEAKARAGAVNPQSPSTTPTSTGKSKHTLEGFRQGLRRAVSGSS